MAIVHDNGVVEQFAAQRADEAFRHAILPRAPEGGPGRSDPHARGCTSRSRQKPRQAVDAEGR
jgi:hypothetical protein